MCSPREDYSIPRGGSPRGAGMVVLTNRGKETKPLNTGVTNPILQTYHEIAFMK